MVKAYPDCFEAWVNLGYARLMLYCDKLDVDDLKRMRIGQVLCTGFYQRVESIGVRGADSKLWDQAVAALKEALRLKPDLTLARANLGLAYLVDPKGKDVARANENLAKAAATVFTGRTLSQDLLGKARTLVNYAVAQRAAGSPQEALKYLAEADEVAGRLGERVQHVIRYNRALIFADASAARERQQAVDLLEGYLRESDPRSSWWPLAYDRYTALCQAMRAQSKPRTELEQRPKELAFRPLTTVALASGQTVSLGEETEVVLKRLGKPTASTNLAEAALTQYRFEPHGLEFLASDRVLAIILGARKSPPVTLRTSGPGKAIDLRVGMRLADLFDKNSPSYIGAKETKPVVWHLTNFSDGYYYYRKLGLAVSLYEDPPEGEKVAELILVRIPLPDPK